MHNVIEVEPQLRAARQPWPRPSRGSVDFPWGQPKGRFARAVGASSSAPSVLATMVTASLMAATAVGCGGDSSTNPTGNVDGGMAADDARALDDSPSVAPLPDSGPASALSCVPPKTNPWYCTSDQASSSQSVCSRDWVCDARRMKVVCKGETCECRECVADRMSQGVTVLTFPKPQGLCELDAKGQAAQVSQRCGWFLLGSGRFVVKDAGTDGCQKDGSGLVEDTVTGLRWLRNAYEPGGLTLAKAEQYCAGRGMRLPTKDEITELSNEHYDAAAWPCRWYSWTSTMDGESMAWFGSISGTSRENVQSGGAALCVQ